MLEKVNTLSKSIFISAVMNINRNGFFAIENDPNTYRHFQTTTNQTKIRRKTKMIRTFFLKLHTIGDGDNGTLIESNISNGNGYLFVIFSSILFILIGRINAQFYWVHSIAWWLSSASLHIRVIDMLQYFKVLLMLLWAHECFGYILCTTNWNELSTHELSNWMSALKFI